MKIKFMLLKYNLQKMKEQKMTVIAWDTKTLASDSLITDGSTVNYRSKIRLVHQEPSERFPDGQSGILAGTGLLLDIEYLTAWWINHQSAPYPWQENPDYSELVVVTKGLISVFNSQQMQPFNYELGGIHAWGVGKEVALGAMHAGKDAVEAVKICIERCSGCGGDIQYCKLNPGQLKIEYLKSNITYTESNVLTRDML